MNCSKYLFYFLSFLEGASVMAAELLGAKMLAPYFGSSLYVWASVLGITLGGLAMGYFAGGFFSQKKNNERNLYAMLLASAVFLVVMPLSAKEIMLHTAGFSLITAILISSFIFLFPPVFFMGMVSPMIVRCVSSGGEESGKAAGTVFAVSTLGGIISTFLLGFYLIPNFGLTIPAIVIGVILGIIPFIKLISAKKFFSLIFLPIVFFAFNNSRLLLGNSEAKTLYSSEGLLGQIVVADYPEYTKSPGMKAFQRILFVNRSTQTVVDYLNGHKSYFEYVQLISERTKNAAGQKALVLGLGGGSAANILFENGLTVDAVELDERMTYCAKHFFDLNEQVNITIDDARHFIKSEIRNPKFKTKYDVIVLDVFLGEVNPHHLFTAEFFSELKPFLSDSGMFFINGNGFWNGDAGKGMRSVCKTLLASGFNTEIIPTSEEEDYRNLLFIAKKTSGTAAAASSEKIKLLHLDDAIVLTDEKPQLEILNAEANRRWREACMKYFLFGYYSGKDTYLFR